MKEKRKTQSARVERTTLMRLNVAEREKQRMETRGNKSHNGG